MSMTLQEQMFSACNCTIAGTYTIFRELSYKLAKIAEIYALEQQIELIAKIWDIKDFSSQTKFLADTGNKLDSQLNKLKGGSNEQT